MQIEIVKYNYTPMRMAKMKNDNTKYWWWCRETEILIYNFGRDFNCLL